MKRTTIKTLALTLVAGGILAGCGGGASEGQLYKACMQQKGQGATEATCKCFAKEIKASVPPQVARAIALGMEGKQQEADAVMDKMPLEERAKFGMEGFRVAMKCQGAQ